MAEITGPGARPLSPHLWIYRWAGTMAMSIAHRITGGGLYFGMALLAWWLIAAATSEAAFDFINGQVGTWYGQVVLVGFTWALIHHAIGGIRHFIWDVGAGFGKPARDILAWGTLVLSLALTVLVWAIVILTR